MVMFEISPISIYFINIATIFWSSEGSTESMATSHDRASQASYGEERHVDVSVLDSVARYIILDSRLDSFPTI